MSDISSSGSVASLNVTTPYAGDDARNRLTSGRLDMLLRSLLLETGLLEDVEFGTETVDSSLGTATLRTLRQTGALAHVQQDVQSVLLGSTLYEYGRGNQSAISSPVRSARGAGEFVRSPLNTDPGFTRLRRGLERLLAADASLASIGESQNGDDEQDAAVVDERDATESLMGTSVLSHIQALGHAASNAEMVPFPEPPDTAQTSALVGLTEDEREFFRMIQHGGGMRSSRTDDDSEAEEDLSLRSSSRGDPPSSPGLLEPERLPEEQSEPLVGLSGTAPSTSVDESQSEAEDESITGFLRRLAVEDESIMRNWLASDDSGLIHSSRRVLQMGAALAGASLSESEIDFLPRICFESAEEKQCAICLEDFRVGEFLTELPCLHFFHVSCVTNWFRRSTQCPLCRTVCRLRASMFL
mmetsp:Transcript_66624/g.131370  ORF Transcript_66624/g.131370 Transcript_66624/m.131370 type:complete len:414 (-) Transcript_66624:207-1448(-)